MLEEPGELDHWLANFTRAGGTNGGDGRPKRVFVVHGDPDAAEAFAARNRQALGIEVEVPKYMETVTLR